MTYAARPSEFVPCLGEHAASDRVAAHRPGLLRRLLEAVFISRQRQAEREVIGYLERTGGRFTDDIERRITERFVTGQWRR
jgi:hypothetical protein